jgi:hypothetical protein
MASYVRLLRGVFSKGTSKTSKEEKDVRSQYDRGEGEAEKGGDLF